MLYGANPSELAQSQGNYERLFTGAAESNRNAAQAADNASLQAWLHAQAADDNAREFDARNRLAFFADQQNEAARQREEAESGRRFDIESALRRDDVNRRVQFENTVTRPRAAAELALLNTQNANARANNPVALKQLEFAHARAAEDANNGLIESVGQALKRYPGLNQEDANGYFEKSRAARQAIESESDTLVNAADTLNKFQKVKDESDAAALQKPSGGFLGFGTNADELKTTKGKIDSLLATLKTQADIIQNPRSGLMQRLQFDPGTKRYVPVMPNLPWRRGEGGRASSGASGATSSPSGRFTVVNRVDDGAPMTGTNPMPVSPASASAESAEPPLEMSAFGTSPLANPALWSRMGSNAGILRRNSGNAVSSIPQPFSDEAAVPAPVPPSIIPQPGQPRSYMPETGGTGGQFSDAWRMIADPMRQAKQAFYNRFDVYRQHPPLGEAEQGVPAPTRAEVMAARTRRLARIERIKVLQNSLAGLVGDSDFRRQLVNELNSLLAE